MKTIGPANPKYRTGNWPRQMSPSWMMICLHTLQCLAFLKVFARKVWEWRASSSSGCSSANNNNTRQKRWNVSVQMLWPNGTSMSPGGVSHHAPKLNTSTLTVISEASPCLVQFRRIFSTFCGLCLKQHGWSTCSQKSKKPWKQRTQSNLLFTLLLPSPNFCPVISFPSLQVSYTADWQCRPLG